MGLERRDFLTMKSLLIKLVLITFAIVGWVVYDRWDELSSNVLSTTKQLSKQLTPKNTEVKTTTVYKWQDKNGDWQFSNTKPANVADAEIKQFRSDENILPSVTQTANNNNNNNNKKDEKEPGGVIQSIKGKFNEVTDIKSKLETPKEIPAE